MKIRQFIPVAVVVIAGFCGAAQKVGAPIPPIALIATFGAFLIALQLEDHKWGNYLSDMLAGVKEGLKH